MAEGRVQRAEQDLGDRAEEQEGRVNTDDMTG